MTARRRRTRGFSSGLAGWNSRRAGNDPGGCTIANRAMINPYDYRNYACGQIPDAARRRRGGTAKRSGAPPLRTRHGRHQQWPVARNERRGIDRRVARAHTRKALTAWIFGSHPSLRATCWKSLTSTLNFPPSWQSASSRSWNPRCTTCACSPALGHAVTRTSCQTGLCESGISSVSRFCCSTASTACGSTCCASCMNGATFPLV